MWGLGAYHCIQMKHRTDRAVATRPPRTAPSLKKEPLSDDQFQDLLAKAGAFFAEAERDVEVERAAAIQEILQAMDHYGLTVENLR